MSRSRILRRRNPYALLVAFLTAAALFLVSPGSAADAVPPNIPSSSAAQSQLNTLTVRAEGSMTGYSRDLFPHWASSGGCTTRQTVLRRDGTNVVVNSNCQPTSGSWFSAYDGVTLTSPSSVDIDHIVALGEAWRSGANSWTTTRRRDFANDLAGPELIAVSASSNRSKGDRDPASWKPTRASHHCTYARMWVGTKYKWDLALQSSEKTALQGMLNTC